MTQTQRENRTNVDLGGAATLSDSRISGLYSYWQTRILYSLAFGYAAFYLVRQNISVAIPAMRAEFGYSKTQMGIIVFVWAIIYGVGKFVNGYFSDRSNARVFMSLGLFGAALTSLLMSWGMALWFFVGVWMFNAWFQSMGWPPVSKLLTHWFPPNQLGTKWGIANASHQIGDGAIQVLAGYLIVYFGWRSAFFVPAIVCAVIALVLFERLRDTPKSLGLPSVEVKSGLVREEDEEDEVISNPIVLIGKMLKSRNLWFVCLGNMFLYIVRMGIITWAPSFLTEHKGATLTNSAWQVFAFNCAGIMGGITAGWLSDRVFKGRRGPVSFLYMMFMILGLIYFWYVPPGHDMMNALAMIIVGFLVYGPQVLVGVAAADFASKRDVGMAVGLTGTFGYLGAAISGGLGWIADHYGWEGGFIFFISAAVMASICFALTWHARAKVLENN